MLVSIYHMALPYLKKMPILRENIKIFHLYVVLTIISLHTSNVPYFVIYWFIDLSTQRYTTGSSNVYGIY